MELVIRSAMQSDLPAINAIYNHYVVNSTCTWQESPSTLAEREIWWREREGRFEVLVCAVAGEVVGFAALGPYRQRSGYRFTAESSVYLQPDHRGKGIGKRLMLALLDAGRAAGFHSIIAGVCTEHAESIRLHTSLGFEERGRLVEAGFKFGRWLDSVYLQKML